MFFTLKTPDFKLIFFLELTIVSKYFFMHPSVDKSTIWFCLESCIVSGNGVSCLTLSITIFLIGIPSHRHRLARIYLYLYIDNTNKVFIVCKIQILCLTTKLTHKQCHSMQWVDGMMHEIKLITNHVA